MFKLVGTIKRIGDEQTVGENFVKRELVLITAEQYPQTVIFQFTQGKTAELDNYGEGEVVKVHFNVRGREWENPETKEVSVFNTLEAWKITPPSE